MRWAGAESQEMSLGEQRREEPRQGQELGGQMLASPHPEGRLAEAGSFVYNRKV